MTLPPPRSIGLGELALRVAAHGYSGDWQALIVQEPLDTRVTADRLAVEFESLVDAGQRLDAAVGPVALTEAAARTPDQPVVIADLEGFGADEWRHLDGLRSLWERQAPVVLVLRSISLHALQQHAPNLEAWLGSAIWQLNPDTEQLSEEQRRARIVALEGWSGRTSAAVVHLAERHELPADPEYAEWLVLLGRGDLLER